MPGFPKGRRQISIDGNGLPPASSVPAIPASARSVGQRTSTASLKQTPCYAWNNTFNGAKLLMTVDPRGVAGERGGDDQGGPRLLQREAAGGILQTLRSYRTPQEGWEARTKSIAAQRLGLGSAARTVPAGKRKSAQDRATSSSIRWTGLPAAPAHRCPVATGCGEPWVRARLPYRTIKEYAACRPGLGDDECEAVGSGALPAL